MIYVKSESQSPPAMNKQRFVLSNDTTSSSEPDVYLTPDSKDSLSENDATLEWTEDDMKKINYLLHYDFTLNGIKDMFPSRPVHSIVSKILSSGSPAWTRAEVVLLANYQQSLEDLDTTQLSLRSHQDIQDKLEEVAGFLQCINIDDSWNKEDVSLLVFQMSYDLTLGGLFEELPDVHISKICDAITLVPAWTPMELFYLSIAKFQERPMVEVSEELPLRLEEEILVELKLVTPQEFIVDKDLLDYLFATDATRKNLRLNLPGVPTREIVMNYAPLKLFYHKEELDLMEKMHKEGRSLAYMQSYLPFRTTNSLQVKLKSITNGYRKSVFKNSLDRLVYMSNWFCSDEFKVDTNNPRATRSTRSKRKSESPELIEEIIEGKKTKLTRAEFEEHKRRKQEIEEKYRKRKEEAHARHVRMLKEAKRNPNPKRKRSNVNKVSSTLVKKLAIEAEYFQSVTGDKKLVKDNEKRKRQQTTFFVPQFEDRKMLKRIMNKKERRGRPRGRGRPPKRGRGRPRKIEETPEFSGDESSGMELSDEEDEEDEFSPFDPSDITADTIFDMKGRQLFADEIHYRGTLPELNFVPEDLEVDSLEEMKPDLYQTDVLSAKIILDFPKRYCNLGSSFPPLHLKKTNPPTLNPLNRIRLRTLLYPEYSELFILADPKTNELNPLYEMQKFFQIHYALFFSHSETLKDIIYEEYCVGIEDAITGNRMKDFTFIVDKWNTLMLALSPSPKAKELWGKDINPEIRKYLTRYKYSKPTMESISADVFLGEICVLQSPQRKKSALNFILNTPEAEDRDSGISPGSDYDLIGDLQRPKSYTRDFYAKLQSKSTVSRYCMQQLLIRVYARVVSTRSRELRKYKAFTAEVYGELLPSFVSEVLSKVDFKPNQKFYDLGSGVGNTSFQAAIEFGASFSGGCELMEHASRLTSIQQLVIEKHMKIFGLKPVNMEFALAQSFVLNETVRKAIIDCDVLIVNNYLFDMKLNVALGRLLYNVKPGTKIISLKNFISPRYKSTGEKTVFDYLEVEQHEMSDFFSVSWTANKVPYYISTVMDTVRPQYL